MYVIIWEYRVKAEHIEEFEKIYGARGEWAELFQKQNGYLGTELLRDPGDYQHYITIDRWISQKVYDDFLANRIDEYKKLDAGCNGLTNNETLLGRWETINFATR